MAEQRGLEDGRRRTVHIPIDQAMRVVATEGFQGGRPATPTSGREIADERRIATCLALLVLLLACAFGPVTRR